MRRPAAIVAYETQRCARSAEACYRAGILLVRVDARRTCPLPFTLSEEEQKERPFDFARGEALLARACAEGNACGCTARTQSIISRGVEDGTL